jgi:hemerythrin-like domain-containing protein
MPKRNSTKRQGDAIELLTEDHRRVQKLFKDAESLGDDDQEALETIVQTACTELSIHAQVEEELVYPVLRDALEDQDLILEAEVEHQSAHDLIAALEAMDATDERYKATFTVLGEYVNHHIKEEEKEVFPQARKADLDLAEMGEQIKTRKEELQAELGVQSPGETEEASSGEK